MKSDQSADFDALVFQQELHEVFLLLDFISGRSDKHLAGLDGVIPDPDQAGRMLSAGEVVARVSTLRYPPTGSPADNAKAAGFLLMLKDELNWMARPARGLTIAYTILFVTGGAQLRSLDAGAGAEAAQGGAEPAGDRGVSAQTAFPGLVDSARRARATKIWMTFFGVVFTAVAALLFWHVTYGVQLAARFDAAKLADTNAAVALYDRIDKDAAGGRSRVADLARYCGPVTPGDPDPHPDGSGSRLLCNDYAYRQAVFCASIADIGAYSRSLVFQLYTVLLPMHAFAPIEACHAEGASAPVRIGRQEDAASVAGMLAMMTSYVLPIMFGLIGTYAALFRGIQAKITESTLAPRDRALWATRLPLGFMAGVAVGLFYTPGGNALTLGGGTGALTLTASGIAFLAGYGSEGFFRMLDTLIVRIFNLDDDTRRPAPVTAAPKKQGAA